MSSTKSQVAVATNIPSLSPSQSQKDYSTEESLGRQNSFGNNRRGNMKGKHLTRSHAMRESTSPPRTPTPRAEHGQISPNENASSNHNNNNNNNSHNHNKLHAQSTATRGNSPIIETPAVIVTNQHNQQQQPQQPNVALCNEAEFPKLTPPKSTKGGSAGPRNSNNNNSSNSNGIAENANNKMEYTNSGSSNSSNSNNNNNSGKKLPSELKANGNGGPGYEPSKSVNTNNVNGSNKPQQQQSYNASNALHQALNVADGTPPRGQSQQSMAPANVHNSGMNYQLNATDGNQQQQQSQQQHHQVMYDKENRCPRNDSQNSNMSNMHDDEPPHHQQQQQQHYDRSGGGGGGGGGGGSGKKHRTNSNSKGNKPRLKNMGSSSGSVDGNSNSNNTSGFISRENSGDQFTDHNGADLLSFFKETLNKHPKDRNFLLKVEKELIDFVQERNRGEMRFPPASSYNRMLIHRAAAFFGMDHNVDNETQQCVIVAATKNTRIPEIPFKSLVTHRDDTRKLILKRDTHSFDEARPSYLCPERGNMLDRKAKSFEEREEDYARARGRIFNRSQNESGEVMEENYMNMSWQTSMEQQQQQQQQQSNRNRANGKMQNSTESRDGRNGGAVPKSHSFGNYNGPPSSGGPPLLRGDSANSNKNNSGRSYSKQDSGGNSNTPWRLSPSNNGYRTQTQSLHSDSMNAPPSGYGSEEQSPELSIIICQTPPQLQLPATAMTPNDETALGASVVIANVEHNTIATTTLPSGGLVWAVTDITNVPKGSVLINPQTLQPIVNQDGSIYHFDPSNLPPSQAMTAGGGYHPNQNNSNANNSGNNYAHSSPQHQQQPQQQQHQSQQSTPMNAKKNKSHQMPPSQHHTATATAANTTTTQKSASNEASHADTMSESSTQTVGICTDAACNSNVNGSNNTEEASTQMGADECDNSVTSVLSITTTTSTKNYDRIEVQKFKNQATSPNIPIENEETPKRENSTSSDASTTREQPSRNQPPSSQTPTTAASLNRETPHSARSTPYSTTESHTKRASEEPKSSTWMYTQSYQASDGSTVFHTTSTPNGTPYCPYQQGSDGSFYAIPPSMVYTYPPDGETYFMPVFDPNQQRTDATGLIPAGQPAIYPTAGGATTVVPVATAYPTAQFAAPSMTPIYASQMIYSNEQFTPGGAAVATAAAAPASGQLQQIPMTTYPMGYPYAYNAGFYQPMTYYVPQQALTNAVTAGPALLPPPAPAAPTVTCSHIASGVNLTNGLITAAAAAGPPSNANVALGSGSNSAGANHHTPVVSSSSSYQTHSGTTYFGTGRIKRPPPSHYNSHQSGHQLMAITSSGSATTTYHAVPTLALAAPANVATAAAAAAAPDLSGPGGTAPATTMYTLPQHATPLLTNIIPYTATAAAAAPGVTPAGAQQAHTQGGALAQSVAVHPAGAAHAQQTNAVIAPFYAHHPPMHSHGPVMHTPGPAAIPIVDPSTLATISQGSNNGPNGPGSYGNSAGNNTSQSAPSTPHSLPSQAPQRNPPLFSTPPIMNSAGATNAGVSYSSSSTPHYYSGGDQQSGMAPLVNSPHNSYTPHEKRNNNSMNNSGGKKQPSYNSGSMSRQNSNNAYNGGAGKQPLLNANNETRASPNNGGSSGYQGNRPHSMNKRGNDKPQAPLLSGPPSYSGSTSNVVSNNYHQHHGNTVNDSKPPVRLNAAAATFRQKGNGIEFRRSVSQRNSPGTNSSSNDNSNNTSPNSNVGSNAPTPMATVNCYATSGGYLSQVSNAGINGNPNHNSSVGGEHHPPTAATATPLYITTRGTHIPPQLQHGGIMTATATTAGGAAGLAGSQAGTAAVLTGTATAAEVAAAAAASVAHHHQPLLGAYNPGASGVYIKYPYFAHPSVALPNSRRSPSTDMRPAMAQVGMYPTVNMMVQAPPRHTQSRHPNPNYKGTRPR